MNNKHFKLYFLAGGLGFALATILTVIDQVIRDPNEILPLAGNDFVQMAVLVLSALAIVTIYLTVSEISKLFSRK
ncbi:MAG: hypothetical protein V3U96_01070 [Paracoccaceae bacterium]